MGSPYCNMKSWFPNATEIRIQSKVKLKAERKAVRWTKGQCCQFYIFNHSGMLPRSEKSNLEKCFSNKMECVLSKSFVLFQVTQTLTSCPSEILLFILQYLEQFVQMVKACRPTIIWRGKNWTRSASYKIFTPFQYEDKALSEKSAEILH